MREIAIIKPRTIEQYDDYTKIVESITDWSEVSDEDYRLLVMFSNKYDWVVVERLDKKDGFILSSVKAALEEVRLEKERQRVAAEEAEKKEARTSTEEEG